MNKINNNRNKQFVPPQESSKRTGMLWHVRTSTPEEGHVRIEYFEVVIHAGDAILLKKWQPGNC